MKWSYFPWPDQSPAIQWKDPEEILGTNLWACVGFLERTVLDERWELSDIQCMCGGQGRDGVGREG